MTETTKYMCSTVRTRGSSVCKNALKVPRTLVESRLLHAIQRDLFTEEGLAVFKDEVTRLLAERQRKQKPEQAHAAKRLQEVEREIEHIMTAIKQGILTVTTKAELERAEAERARLLQAMHSQPKLLDKVVRFLPTLTERFRQVVEDLAVVTQAQVDKARGILRELVGGSILLYPTDDGDTRYLTAELAGDYAGLVRLAVPNIKVVAVTRFSHYLAPPIQTPLYVDALRKPSETPAASFPT